VRALAVPNGVDVGMFSHRREVYVFLDGGFGDYRGYGWGSHKVLYLTGTLALRFLCGRLGLQPPRRLNSEGTLLTAAQIEEEFLRQRREEWRTLRERYETMIGRPQPSVSRSAGS
jgi:hypothetical protein